MIVVMLMVLTVDILLLSATGRLLDGSVSPPRVLLGAFVGTTLAGLSMFLTLAFFHSLLCRLLILVVTAWVSFGFSLRKITLYSLLHLSLGNVSDGNQEWLPMLLGALGMLFACLVIGRGNKYVPIELSYGGKTVTLTALRDTGNTLRDPITGKRVLIVSADVAQNLTGLTESALYDPVGALEMLPGLRLIPYQTVGNAGFLLALSMEQVKIGNARGNTLVAFSPRVFDKCYQALIGGNV